METLQRTANRGSVSTGYDVANSVKLQTAGVNSEFFNYTISSAGSRTTGTVSMWIKRTTLGVLQYLWEQGDTDNDNGRLFARFGTDDTLRVAGGSTVFLNTNRVFRDTSAWYHIVVAIDTTSGTADNRARIYVNGVEETSFSTRNNFSQNDNTGTNFEKQFIGLSIADESSFQSFSGYMAEVVFQDGVASAPTEFGEFDSVSGIWIPKDASGATMGTNGAYLKFENAASMGAATAGHGFSVQNINQGDQATDTPTNNFCTWNSLWAYAYPLTITQGATLLEGSQNQWQGAKATFGLQNGRWYWEVQAGSQANSGFFGIQTEGESNIGSGNAQTHNSTYCRKTDGNDIFTVGGSESTSNHGGGNMGNDDILGIFLDLESSTKTLRWFRNGSSYGSTINLASVSTSFTTREVFPFHAMYGSATTNQYNFGGYRTYTISSAVADSNGYGAFEYTPNDGTYDYYSINTKNLAEFG